MSRELFTEHRGRGDPPSLTPDVVRDIHIRADKAYIELVNGETLLLRLDEHLRQLYWEVKIRNRRHAFGLD